MPWRYDHAQRRHGFAVRGHMAARRLYLPVEGKRPNLRQCPRSWFLIITVISTAILISERCWSFFLPGGGSIMRKIPFSIATLCMLSIGSAVPLAAQPARDRGPCEQITAACQGAGFTLGGARASTRLLADCIAPIMQGTAQPRGVRTPLPQIDAKLVTDCKASNPSFGRRSAPPSEPPAQPLPASPASPPAATQKQQPQASAAGIGRPCASTDDSIPSGLVVVLPPGTRRDQSSDLQALNNPYVNGVAVQITWRDIEPVQGKPDWSRLDELFAAAETSKKWVQLLIFPGSFLRRGHSRAQRPICSRYNMDLAAARLRSFRCLGMAYISAVGSRS
jgi:hypothetical protein